MICAIRTQKTKRTVNIVAAVTADIKEDRRLTCKELASSHGVSYGTMNKILHDDLGLVKKSARWVPNLLSEDQKKERVQTWTEFVAAIIRCSMAMLDNIVTMDKTMVSYHTPETKSNPNSGLKGPAQTPSRQGCMPAGQNRCCVHSSTAKA
jgi:hypothetical protein